jgi:hypothetical protein
MKKVYALFKGEYSDKYLVGVYSNKELVYEFLDKVYQEKYKDYLNDFNLFLNGKSKSTLSYYYPEFYYVDIDDEKIKLTNPLSYKEVERLLNSNFPYSIQECPLEDCPDFIKIRG